MRGLAATDVTRVAGDVLARILPLGSVVRVHTAEVVDSFGDEALRISAIVSEGSLIDDHAVDRWVDAGLALQRQLESQGEDRFPYLRLVTEEEAGSYAENDAA